MDPIDFTWISKIAEFVAPFADVFWAILSRVGDTLSTLQARYPQLFSPQTLFGLIGTTIAIWKWWEAREANLFRKFEEMIARNEAQLVKARNDLLDVMMRPGPGVRIRPPLFVGEDLKRVLVRRKWMPRSLFPIKQRKLDVPLEQAVRTSEMKVAAHLRRLSLFRSEIAAARLIQGAVASGRVAHADTLHEQQALNLEAFDRFREVLALPGHREDTTGLELLANQLDRMEEIEDERTIEAYQKLVGVLLREEESYERNLALARAKRGLGVLKYSSAPALARDDFNEAIEFLTRLGPPRDRQMLELATLIYLSGITYLRLGATKRGPTQLQLAESYFRNLVRSLRSHRGGLFRWMLETRKFTGHRTAELLQQAEEGLAIATHLVGLCRKRRSLLIRSLQRGCGVRRHNRKPLPLPKGH